MIRTELAGADVPRPVQPGGIEPGETLVQIVEGLMTVTHRAESVAHYSNGLCDVDQALGRGRPEVVLVDEVVVPVLVVALVVPIRIDDGDLNVRTADESLPGQINCCEQPKSGVGNCRLGEIKGALGRPAVDAWRYRRLVGIVWPLIIFSFLVYHICIYRLT